MTFRRDHSGKGASRYLSSGFRLTTYSMAVPSLAGRDLLFFSDVHLTGTPVRNFWGGPCPGWENTAFLTAALQEALRETSPEYLVFGGDLLSHSCVFPEAFRMLASLQAPYRIAVCGNWDRRRRWMPFFRQERAWREAGFELLLNREIRCGNVSFYGMDDWKLGSPEEPDPAPDRSFRILLSHNPDGAAALPEKTVSAFDLVLCGHTHGGQIRLPFFGALRTSSRHWKKYEYGAYVSSGRSCRMIVSSGLGTTWIPWRVNCPPEIVCVSFTA